MPRTGHENVRGLLVPSCYVAAHQTFRRSCVLFVKTLPVCADQAQTCRNPLQGQPRGVDSRTQWLAAHIAIYIHVLVCLTAPLAASDQQDALTPLYVKTASELVT